MSSSTLLERVVPEAALTIGLALLTIRPKLGLRRANLNRAMSRGARWYVINPLYPRVVRTGWFGVRWSSRLLLLVGRRYTLDRVHSRTWNRVYRVVDR